MLGVNSEQKESMQHYIHVQTNASVGYLRKFHKATGMPTSLNSIFFAGPYLLCWSHRSGVRCWLPLSVVPRQLLVSLVPPPTASVRGSTPTLLLTRLSAVLSPTALSAPLSNQLSFASPFHFRIRRDFRSKNPLSGFAPKQTKESSAWRATHIVLQFEFPRKIWRIQKSFPS